MSACQLADVKPKRRFAEISEEQLQTIVENKNAVNTKRSTNQAVKIFREYLAEKALLEFLKRKSFIMSMSKALLICLLNPNLIVVRDDFL
jgi:hypothetical protein